MSLFKKKKEEEIQYNYEGPFTFKGKEFFRHSEHFRGMKFEFTSKVNK